jgi:hypothetical protein
MLGSLLALALAATPEILLPPWPLSPDGDLVAVRGGDPLRAERGAVEPIAPGLFRVVPPDGAPEVRLSAGAATAVAQVEPPPSALSISFAPASPVKGRNREVALEIAVVAAPGAEPVRRPPELVASSGRVRGIASAGEGRFRAVYELPATRHPEVVTLLAIAPRCPTCPTPRAVGYALIPLPGAIALPGTSEPGVRTTLVIGGRSFGPAVADAAGRFTVPVVVPPGARTGIAESVDALGNRKRKEVDLHLPAVSRLACAAWPRAVPADGESRASVWCVASSPSGQAEPGARLALSARAGEVSGPAPFRGALQRATYRAPRGGGGADAGLVAEYPEAGPASRGELRLALATGAPAEIAADVSGEPVPLGASVPAETAVRDANGDLVGRPSGPPGAGEGFVAPDRFAAPREPGDYRASAPLSFALAPGAEAATLSLRREGGQWVAVARTVDARPAAGVALRFGSGAAATTDSRGEARAPARGPRETVAAPNGARAAGFEGFASPPAPFEIARTISVELRPAAPVDILARIEGRFLRWTVVDAAGGALAARPVALRSSGVALGPPERDADGGRAELRGGRGTVAVVDVSTGIAAVLEVP